MYEILIKRGSTALTLVRHGMTLERASLIYYYKEQVCSCFVIHHFGCRNAWSCKEYVIKSTLLVQFISDLDLTLIQPAFIGCIDLSHSLIMMPIFNSPHFSFLENETNVFKSFFPNIL